MTVTTGESRPEEEAAAPTVVARTYPAVPASVPAVRRELTAFATAHGAGGDLLRDVAVAVTEAATNVVVHAYEPGQSGPIEVVADVEDGTLEVIVADDGLGLRPRQSAGLGFGLKLISATTATFAIRPREPHGTEVWMRFLLPRS